MIKTRELIHYLCDSGPLQAGAYSWYGPAGDTGSPWPVPLINDGRVFLDDYTIIDTENFLDHMHNKVGKMVLFVDMAHLKEGQRILC